MKARSKNQSELTQVSDGGVTINNPHVTVSRMRESLLKRSRAHERCARHFRKAAKQLQISTRLIGD